MQYITRIKEIANRDMKALCRFAMFVLAVLCGAYAGTAHKILTRLLTLALLAMVGVGSAWAQDRMSGVLDDGYYKIVNVQKSAEWYLVPAQNPENLAQGVFKDGKPILTTKKTDDKGNFTWRLKKMEDGRYQMINAYFWNYVHDDGTAYNTARCAHMESAAIDGDAAYLFYIPYQTTVSAYTIYGGIVATKTNGTNTSFNNYGNNSYYDNYYETNASKVNEGVIGYWLWSGDPGSQWYIEKAPCPKPRVNYDPEENTISFSYPVEDENVTFRYTTDGTDPSSASTAYDNSPLTVNEPTIYKVIATRDGFQNSEVVTYRIVVNPTIEIEPDSYTYDGSAKEPAATVKFGEITIPATEYTVSYSNNTNAGTATVTITDNEGGDYYVAGSKTFTINQKSIGSGGAPASDISVNVFKNKDGSYRSTVRYGSITLVEGTDYDLNVSGTTATIIGKGNYAGSVTVEVSDVSYQYVALHASAKGYLKRHNDNGILANDGTFRYGNSFENNTGSSIWVLSSDGHLQSDYYYLNVSNDRKLYLSVTPLTTWETEDVGGSTKQHVYVTVGGTRYYLCNDANVELKASPTNYYNACPITLTESSLTPAAAALTVKSPQMLTYLRNCYFTQTMSYSFTNDAGTTVSGTNQNRRVFVTLKYKSSTDASKGTKWDVNADGDIIYNKQASGNVDVTATYEMLAADPIIQESHPDPVEVSFKTTVQPKPLTLVDSKNYLLFSIPGGNNYRYPYDDGTPSEGDAVKPDGKGGTGNTSVLTDPEAEPNAQISWQIETDDMGYYMFKNVNSGRYLRFDETKYAGDGYGYGTLCVGSTTVPSGAAANDYKFRLYANNNSNYGTCYYIIPYCRQFAFWKSDGLMSSDYVYPAININQYTGKTTKAISLFKADGNSQWCIYKYEATQADYRIRPTAEMSISGQNNVSATGDYTVTSNEGWYGKYITESPKSGDAQRALVISGTYNTNKIVYQWEIQGLGDYVEIDGGTQDATTGTWSQDNTNNRTLKFKVTALPTTSRTGFIRLRWRGGENAENSDVNPYRYTGYITFNLTIQGTGVLTLTEISSLNQITDANGAYKLADNITVGAMPDVSTFSGILDGNGKTITGLGAPLFESISNADIYNLNLAEVNISQSGNVGAIAGTANGTSHIYNIGILSGTLASSDARCGGLIGELNDFSRVINCFSYANIEGGTDVGGIVGYNSYASTTSDLRTMVMNCMFYGDITGGTKVSPIYGGKMINNSGSNALNNFNYYSFADFTSTITTYNCALGAEERFLTRFEFYRQILNSNRELAAWYATGSADNARMVMAKWVLDKAVAPYPILKQQGKYTSIVNYDPAAATSLGSLEVTIGGVGDNAPTGASITTTSLKLTRTDKDSAHFNFNYDKVQLPYYNDIGTKNYTGNRVVVGWKVTAITGGTAGTFKKEDSAEGYNFADRNCTQKDLYSVTGRVLSQGAYFNVPNGVTAITIEPYWANAVYLSDPNYDKTYSNGYTGYDVTNMGTRFVNGQTYSINGNSQVVYTNMTNAINALNRASGKTVYDYAVVLVGNYHHYYGNNSINNDTKGLTIMSADLDGDNEPDNCFFYQHQQRQQVTPIRFDFLCWPGIGMAQKPSDSPRMPGIGIFKPRGWFEVTNTVTAQFYEVEYDWSTKNAETGGSPLILLGGVIEQIASSNDGDPTHTKYIHIGDNAWFKMFNNGIHQDKTNFTPHIPISVTGGDYDRFYLSGMFRPGATVNADNAECYISGGRFGELAGAGQEQIKGDVTWKIDHADIASFYGGGINDAKPVLGNITVLIANSKVGFYCGGPKFGNMASGKAVSTTATNCTFGRFFGAGYGGTSFNRISTKNLTNAANYGFSSWVASDYKRQYNSDNSGIATNYEYELFAYAGFADDNNVGRFYVNYASLSLAIAGNVTSTLTDCTVTENFYGGGCLGKVVGNVASTLTSCTVLGSVYGAGFSAKPPTVDVLPIEGFVVEPHYDGNTGTYTIGVLPTAVTYTWKDTTTVLAGHEFVDKDDKHYILTTVDMSSLGTVQGDVEITITGDSHIGTIVNDANTGHVFGGGEESQVVGNTSVVLSGNTDVMGNVYGGGKKGNVSGSTSVLLDD